MKPDGTGRRQIKYVKRAARVRLDRDEIALGRPAGMRSLCDRVGELLGLATGDGKGPEQSLQVHHDGLMVRRHGDGEVSPLVDRDPLGRLLSNREAGCKKRNGDD
jgi:hypothetical protein